MLRLFILGVFAYAALALMMYLGMMQFALAVMSTVGGM